jgi:hypothetical protein
VGGRVELVARGIIKAILERQIMTLTRPTYVAQPGPVAAKRVVAMPTGGRPLELNLRAGLRLVDAVAEGFAAAEFASGTVDVSGVALGPFAYVMPALSKTGENAAFYSDTFRPAGITRIKHGAMTFGRRDGMPFFHTHALWTEADGRVTGGHILPDDTIVAAGCSVPAFGITDAVFEGNPDPETNFKLFGPVASNDANRTKPPDAHSRIATAIRLRPNQDFTVALEAVCASQQIKRARIHGGVGSTIGAAFDDGRIVHNFATEVYIREGMIIDGIASLDVGLVDYTGGVAEGRLKRGANPVLMTFELIIERLG